MSNQFSVNLTLETLSKSVVKESSLPEGWNNILVKDRLEMPGIMTLITEYSALKPLKGIRLSGCQHLTNQTMICIEAYLSLGAEVRWCSSNPLSTVDFAATYLSIEYPDKVTCFAWKGETMDEYWWCVYQALSWPGNKGPHTLHDDGCSAYSMLHHGVTLEKSFEQTRKKGSPNDFKVECYDEVSMVNLLNKILDKNPKFWRNVAADLVGITEQTTSGVTAFRHFYQKNELLATVFCANDSITKSKFDNIYGTRQSALDGFMRATEVMMAGKEVVVIGYGQVGRGAAEAFRGAGARVRITEVDPICALQASMQGYDVVLLEDFVETADIFITTTGSIKNIRVEHMLKMKEGAILGNIGQGNDEICVEELSNLKGVKKISVKPFVDKYILPNGNGITILADGRLYNLACASGHPSFALSTSFCNQIFCQMEVAKNLTRNEYGKVLVKLPKIIDEKIAKLHLPHLNAKLTKLTQEQADFMGVPIDGPFKQDTYPY